MKKILMTLVLAPMMAMALELSPLFAPEAIAKYKVKADADDAEAQFLYAWALSMGATPGIHDSAAAFDYAKKAAGQGFEWAYHLVGLGYAEGWNGSSNAVDAAVWYGKFFTWAKPAAEKGNAWAQLQLGECYERGFGIEKDPKEAVKWYRKAAEQGCAIAQAKLSECYGLGKGVERDENEEQKWERKAAEQGEYSSQVNLGIAYGNGYYGERDPVEAVKWYRKAAEQGFVQAQCLLGLCYRRGIGVATNHAEAVKWYRMAAGAGDRGASYRLWLYYVNGEGVEKNLTEAVKWYAKMAKNDWQPLGDYLNTDELYANMIGEKEQADNMQKLYDSLVALGKGLKDCSPEVKAYYEKDLSFAKGKLEQEKIKPLAGVRRARSKPEKTPEPELKEDVDGFTWSYRVSDTWSCRARKKVATITSASPKLIGDVTIPLTLGGVPVMEIGNDAFRNCEKLTSVTFPPSVETIGWHAFMDCSSLASVSIPAGVRWILPGAFSGCKSLKAITVSEENEQYVSKDGVVFGKEMKTLVCYPSGISGEYVVPSGVKKIDSNAFAGCSGLTSIVISDSVREIEEGALSGCQGLVSISVDPANKRYASQDGVLFDKDMKTVVRCPGGLSGAYAIPTGVTSIGRFAFGSCRKLTAVTIPASVTAIGWHAFGSCQKLTAVTIPAGVINIGGRAFYGCDGLESVTISSDLTNVVKSAFRRDGKFLPSTNGMTTVVFEKSGVNMNAIERRVGRSCDSSLRARRLQRQQQAQAAAAKRQNEQAATAAERQTQAEQEKAQREAERAEQRRQRRQLQAIQEELKRVREQKAAAVAGKGDSATAGRTSNASTSGVNAVVQKLQGCDFLLNKDFKKNAKFYLCLFSASWCGPCRREMPRIAKIYAEMLKDDPDIELIHFSRDQNDEKALAWAKKHDVKFPVVKPKGGNPLDLQCNGIPHLFIIKANGVLLKEGHPASLFTEEKLRELKAGK